MVKLRRLEFCFVMYYIYRQSGPSLLIESTDSIINGTAIKWELVLPSKAEYLNDHLIWISLSYS